MKQQASTSRNHPAQDWRVLRATDHGPGLFYRYSVSGENMNYPPGAADRTFSWSVPDLDNARYDLSACVWTGDAT